MWQKVRADGESRWPAPPPFPCPECNALVGAERVAPPPVAAAVEAYNRGVTQFLEPNDALATFDDAVRLDPLFAHAVFARGVMYSFTCRGDQALKDYDRAIKLNPVVPEFYRARAFHYLELRCAGGSKEECDQQIEADLERARWLERKPNLIWADTSLTSTMGPKADAMRIDFMPKPISPQQVRQASIDGAPAGRGQAVALYVKAMDCMEKVGQDEEALRLLKDAIAADPTYPNAYEGLYDVYSSMGRADEAIAAIRKCGELKALERAKSKKWWQIWK